MKNKVKIIIFFITIIMFLVNCYAAPAYYYANTYKVDILNVNKDDIEKVEVLAPISEGKEEVQGIEYEYILSSLFDYYGTSNIENEIKCFKYTNVKKLKFKENKCIVEINKINDFQQDSYQLYFGGTVFLRITKSNGEKVYSKMFSCYDLVDEDSTVEEYAKAKLYTNTIGIFECNFNSGDGILEVELKKEDLVENKIKIFTIPLAFWGISFVIVIVIICVVLVRRKN